jgi:hypothetical protein
MFILLFLSTEINIPRGSLLVNPFNFLYVVLELKISSIPEVRVSCFCAYPGGCKWYRCDHHVTTASESKIKSTLVDALLGLISIREATTNMSASGERHWVTYTMASNNQSVTVRPSPYLTSLSLMSHLCCLFTLSRLKWELMWFGRQ